MSKTHLVGDYHVSRLYPLDLSWNEALDCGECIVRAFHDEMWPWWGPRYRQQSYQALQWIADPRLRLAEYIHRQKCYASLVRTWARECRLEILDSGRLAHGLYQRIQLADNKTHDRLVGYTLWTLPTHMIADNDREMGREGWKYELWAWWRSMWHSVGDLWEYLFDKEHPIDNRRYSEYIDDPEDAEDLPPNTDEALERLVALGENVKSALYRPVDMCYLDYMVVDPDHQNKGIGGLFLEWSIADIPNVKTPFEGRNKTIYGPQKLFLKSTARGVPFYKKHGFAFTVDESHYDFVHMVRTR